MISRVYYNNFRNYLDDLNKLLDPNYDKSKEMFLYDVSMYKIENFDNFNIDKRI